jgi:phosphopentomutase
MVLDSVGIGELPDADEYGDVGSDTLGNIADTVDGFELPNLVEMGLGNIEGVDNIGRAASPRADFGRMKEISIGKDTTTGHWEFVGVVLDEPFQTFPNGFDDHIIEKFVEATGCGGVLGNKPESGTVIIEELGKEHEQTGQPIVYTSADPVFQIAAHEDVVDVETLYEWCEAAYDIVIPEGISRVIARPFVGDWPDYTRTSRRKDFAFPPPKKTVCEELKEAGLSVTGVGKIGHIFSHRGMSKEIPTENNQHGMDVTLERMEAGDDFIFTNLVDFDSKYGHRRNPEGYAQALMNFDERVNEFVDAMDKGDLLILTADHGNDPTFRGTDHTREYVPLLVLQKGLDTGRSLGTRSSFCDIGASVADYFGVSWEPGESFLT